jgi:hypothetical protein
MSFSSYVLHDMHTNLKEKHVDIEGSYMGITTIRLFLSYLLHMSRTSHMFFPMLNFEILDWFILTSHMLWSVF